MPEREEPETAQPEINPFQGVLAKVEDQVRVRDEDFFSVYANSLAIGMSSWDTWVVFGEITDKKVDGKPIIKETLKVSMTREVMKVFSYLLATNIAAYEKQNGEIKVPEIQLAAVQTEVLTPPTGEAAQE